MSTKISVILRVNKRFIYIILVGAIACTALPDQQFSLDASAVSMSDRVKAPSNQESLYDPLQIPFPKFSDYGFFEGSITDFQPAKGVHLYQPANELFTDYATKLRFIKIPGGEKITWNAKGEFEFPLHSVLVKHFLYPDTDRPLDGPIQMMESRILYLSESGWQAYTYVWNETGTEAVLNQVGDFKSVSYTHDGKRLNIEYVVPNKNECKNCHQRNNEMLPLGPTPNHLNFSWTADGISQIAHWVGLGILDQPQSNWKDLSPSVVWNEPETGSIQQRALAYLEANCGHCHHPEGSAHTSGLFLQQDQKDPRRWGIGKPPVAAGKGSGNRKYSVEPGHPERSIILYRMSTNEPGEMMPELGRSVVHEEGIQLIRDWINSL